MAGNCLDSGRTVTSKVTAILLTFAQGNEHSMAEIARLTGLPISTAHRLMTELTSSAVSLNGPVAVNTASDWPCE